MKKGLLVYRINRDDPGNIGVIKKCLAQQKAFQSYGFETDMLWLCENGVLLNESLIAAISIPPHSWRVYWFYFFRFGKIIKRLAIKNQYDFIYLRHPFFDPLLFQSLQSLKRDSPYLKLLLEINTYPYDAEPKRFLHRLSLWMDQHYRKYAHHFIDRIVDYGQRDKIWKIPTISIRNGIEVEKIPTCKGVYKEGVLRLIAVGNWSYWHGLDRLIRGFKVYNEQAKGQKVTLAIVGDGPHTIHQKKMVEDLKLEAYIRFYPPTRGAALNDLFNQADVGIGTLGMHRKGVEIDSSLKHREYCARGIPFILSARDLDFPTVLDFVHYVSKDDEDIDLHGILNWFSPSYKTKVRPYAIANLDWSKQLSPVTEYLLQPES